MADKSAPPPAECVELRPGIRRILAPNPSFMTLHGTNTYILGKGRVAIIDPGPAIETHLDAVLGALSVGETVSHVFVTHAHLDHSGLSARLASATGAPVYAFGTAQSGRSIAMERIAQLGLNSGGEGLDRAFRPDVLIDHGARFDGGSWAVEAIHTPGHLGGHLCFASNDILFSGDHVMGWSTSFVSPPDGDMTDYMASLDMLARRQWDIILPAHGDPVTDPAARICDLIAHRRAREAALMAAIGSGAKDIAAMAQIVYPELAPKLLAAAHRNILAHLIDMEARKMILAAPHISESAIFTAL